MTNLSRLIAFQQHMKKSGNSCKIILLGFVLIILVLGVYLQVGDHQFLNFDDNVYVTENPHVASGITQENVVWAFTAFDYEHWQPITWLSHMIDVQLYGLSPRGHHLTNVVLHVVASLLLLILLYRSTGELWRSSFVAYLFALHPLHVESVAWVAERKDVLSAVFWFLTLLMYVEYKRKRIKMLYFIALISFVFGIMSKPMLVSLPLVMLLYDFWPLKCVHHNSVGLLKKLLDNKQLLLEKILFFVCALFSGAATIYGQEHSGAIRNLNEISILLRIENACVSYVKYIGKTLWPEHLVMFYPFHSSIPFWQVLGALIILLVIFVLVVRTRQSHPYCTMGWFWFVITLVPVIGILQVGNQSMADRYSYIPGVGLFVMIAWGIPEYTRRMKLPKPVIPLSAGVVIVIFSVLSWQQASYWRDNISLYTHTLQHTEDNFMIHSNLGLALTTQGEWDAAILHYKESLRINSKTPLTHNNLGLALAKKGDIDAAIHEYQTALSIDQDFWKAHNSLGMALTDKGDLDAAIREYKEAQKLEPNRAEPHYNLGTVFARKGDHDAAIGEYSQALRISPNDIDARMNLGVAFAMKKDFDAAIQEFQSVLQANPNNDVARQNLNLAVMQKRMQNLPQ